MASELIRSTSVSLSREEALAFHRIAGREGHRAADRIDFDRARAAFARAGKLGDVTPVFATRGSGAIIPAEQVSAVADRTFPAFDRAPQPEDESGEQASA